MSATIQVSGLKELRSALKRVNADAPKELAKTNHEAGQIVVDVAKRLAPSGPHEGGGNVAPIASSIHANQAGVNVTIIAGGARSPHAAVYEFGGTIPRHGMAGSLSVLPKGRKRWVRRGHVSTGVTHIKRRPYLYPAIAATKNVVEEAYMGMLRRLVETFQR